jgi:hypothetical protein
MLLLHLALLQTPSYRALPRYLRESEKGAVILRCLKLGALMNAVRKSDCCGRGMSERNISGIVLLHLMKEVWVVPADDAPG